jgi:large subunit ribosomal protein L30
MAKIRIRLVKSVIGSLPKQRATVRSLGLRKIGSVNELEASPAVLGMVRVVSHMVSVEKPSEGQSSSGEQRSS